MSLHHRLPHLLRLLALSGCLAAGAAHASNYSEVTALTKAGQHAAAIEKANAYLASNARDPQMRFLKGVAQSQSGDLAAATATLESLIEEYPELPEPYNNLAVIYASQNQLDKARIALESAVRNNPKYGVAHENLGDIYARLAHDAYQKSIQLSGSTRGLQLKLSTLSSMLQPDAP